MRVGGLSREVGGRHPTVAQRGLVRLCASAQWFTVNDGAQRYGYTE